MPTVSYTTSLGTIESSPIVCRLEALSLANAHFASTTLPTRMQVDLRRGGELPTV